MGKPNKSLLKAAENRFKNSKPECENSKTNSTVNNDELPIPSKTPGRSNEKSRRSPTKPRKTRRTCPEYKTWSTNSRLKSRPTNDRPKKLKKLPTPTSASTESFSTSLTKLKNELIWLNLPLTNSDLKPEDIKLINIIFSTVCTFFPNYFKMTSIM